MSDLSNQPAVGQVDPSALRQPEAAATGAAFGLPATVSEAVVSAVPAAARGRLQDRLRKRKPIRELVDLGDGDVVLVKGMDVLAAEAMQARVRATEGDPEEEAAPASMASRNPIMMRSMCFDPETLEPVFGTGEIVAYRDPRTGEQQSLQDERFTEPVVDGFTDEEINGLPIGDVNKLMQAINRVMGLDGGPGKGSPSTGDADSSSSSPAVSAGQ
jgi:hypothetical protein